MILPRALRNTACSICAAAIFCVAPDVPAQTVYRQVDAEGRVSFSDVPDAAVAARAATVSAADVANALANNSPISSRRAALIDANEASRRLGQAQFEREQGTAALPGEQVGHSDANAMNLRYRQRQEKLQRSVEQAQHRWSETRRSPRKPKRPAQ